MSNSEYVEQLEAKIYTLTEQLMQSIADKNRYKEALDVLLKEPCPSCEPDEILDWVYNIAEQALQGEE